MSADEETIVRLLRNALKELPRQDAGATYMRRIQDLDPPNMTSLNEQGELQANTFFDICCKVQCSACCAPIVPLANCMPGPSFPVG
jgi:hypothetical protein